MNIRSHCVIVVCISQSGAHYCTHILCSTMHGCQLSSKTGTELIAPELLVQVCRLLGQGRTWLRTSQWETTACLHLYMCSLWMRVVYLGVWGELVNRSLIHCPSSQGWVPRCPTWFVFTCLYCLCVV